MELQNSCCQAIGYFTSHYYCGILTNCSADVMHDGLEQMEGVFEIGMTV